MFNRVNSLPHETSQPPDQPTLNPPAPKSNRNKLYAVTALIAVAIIAIALLIPQGAAIPLNVNYTVGEKMIYDNTVTVAFPAYNMTGPSGLMGQSLNNTSANSKQSIEVIDFDGEYYTLNHSMTMAINQKPFSFSYLEKMNKTGYSTYIFNFGTQQITSNTSGIMNTYITPLLNRTEVRVGDSWPIPFPTGSSSSGVTGGLTMTFRGFEDLTVPAGTYKVFRVDITSNNLSMHFNPLVINRTLNGISNMNIDMSVNGQIYMEYGTMRQIKSTLEENVSYQSTMMNYTMNLVMQMTLEQHIRP